MKYAMITGGVTSGIGKGCLSAVLGRSIALAGIQTAYQKIEPCLQKDIRFFENIYFGEIVVENEEIYYDGDVARAKFFIPNYSPKMHSDLSLGNILRKALSSDRFQSSPSPKIAEVSLFMDQIAQNEDTFYIIEIGGTSGEVEHKILISLLQKRFGKPTFHIHLTTCITIFNNHSTTKAAQISLNNLDLVPDLVFVRNAESNSISTLQNEFGNHIKFLPLDTNDIFPEKAYYEALKNDVCKKIINEKLAIDVLKDEIFNDIVPIKKIAIIHDGAGRMGYQSLFNRILVWGKQQIQAIFFDQNNDISSLKNYDAVILIGERNFSFDINAIQHIPYLDLRFKNSDDSRIFLNRADWQGSADKPTGDLYNFICKIISDETKKALYENVYSDTNFAKLYLKAAEASELRDHNVLDDYFWSCFGTDEDMENSVILDIGCGAGRWAEKLAKLGSSIVGVEPAEPMYLEAIKKSIQNFQIFNTSIEDFQTDKKFDYIIASMSLDHCTDLEGVLIKCSKWLKEGGRFIISTEHPIRTCPNGDKWIEINGKRKSLVYDYGIEGVRNHYWFNYPNPVKVIHRKLETWISLATLAKLNIVAIKEPVTLSEKDANNPRFWLLVAEKPSLKSNIITIDGNSRTGKTTIGNMVAEAFNLVHIDSGLIMRFFFYYSLNFRNQVSWSYEIENFKINFYVENRNITQLLFSESLALSIAQTKEGDEIRNYSNKLIFELVEKYKEEGCVISGRAMGKKIKAAKLRICLICSDEKRIQRSEDNSELIMKREISDSKRYTESSIDIESVVIDTSHSTAESIFNRLKGIIEVCL